MTSAGWAPAPSGARFLSFVWQRGVLALLVFSLARGGRKRRGRRAHKGEDREEGGAGCGFGEGQGERAGWGGVRRVPEEAGLFGGR